jgi:hypothetical protein
MVSGKKITGLFFGLMLSGVVVAPYAFAEDSCSTCDLITSVNDIKGVIVDKNDMKTSELSQSIINYLAQIEQNRYNLMIVWHTDPAPGTDIAMTTGKNLSKVAYGQSVVDKVGDRLIDGLGVVGPGGIPQKNPEALIYDQLKNYYQTAVTDPGNTAQMRNQLAIINFANLYQKSSIPADDANVNLLVKLITDPYPTRVAPPADNDIEGKTVVANAAIEKAIVSVALNTFMDMLAKRNPNAENQNQSMLQLMEKESSWRIQDVKWFQNISLSSQEAVLREMAQMMAFNMWMNYQQYRQNEQIAAMMAASIASQARLNSTMISMSKVLGDVKGQAKAAQAEAEVQKLKIETPE